MAGGSAAQRVPLERLVVIVSRLSQARGRPVDADELLALVSYGAATVQDRRDQLHRDIRQLSQLGWDIENVGGAGGTAKYRLDAVDNRLRVMLTPAERFALLRVARLAASDEVLAGLGVPEAAGPSPDGGSFASDAAALEVLDPVAWARANRCLLRFRYKGRARAVHPWTLTAMASGWYLTGREDGDDLDKVFRLSRMSEVTHDDPGTALAPPPTPAPPALDPLAWPVDDPLVAVVSTSTAHLPLVASALGVRDVGAAVVGGSEDAADGVLPQAGATVVLEVPVTNRSAFVGRLVRLGERVRLDGPPQLREVLRDRLVAVAAAGQVR